MRKLSELEGVALGIIHKRQPCTAYSVRIELKASPSSHWRASAGAIYPLLARLENEKLIKSVEDAGDGRGRKLLTITPSGKKAFKGWVREIVDPELISEVHDPLRTRIFFLDALTNAQQVNFAENALEALNDHLIGAEEHLRERPASRDLFEHLGSAGGLMNAESRIKFLKTVLAQIRKRQ